MHGIWIIFLFSGTATVGVGWEVIFHTTILYKEKVNSKVTGMK